LRRVLVSLGGLCPKAHKLVCPSFLEASWEKTSSEYANWQKNYKASSHHSELQRIHDKKLPENWDKQVYELLDKVLQEKPGHASRMSS
jgi:hypothetical protein